MVSLFVPIPVFTGPLFELFLKGRSHITTHIHWRCMGKVTHSQSSENMLVVSVKKKKKKVTSNRGVRIFVQNKSVLVDNMRVCLVTVMIAAFTFTSLFLAQRCPLSLQFQQSWNSKAANKKCVTVKSNSSS